MTTTQAPHTVLLVDDQEVNLELGRVHLEAAGYRVVMANDGPNALDSLRRQTIDLVLLDIVMPEMDGLEVLEALRGDPRTARLPVIMATARQESADMVRAFDLGADDYVTKPLEWVVVVARIRAHLRAHGGANENPTLQPSVLVPGSLVDGRYLLEAPLGRGAHGTVWQALDTARGTARGTAQGTTKSASVAVKMLATSGLDNPGARERFRREGLTLCRIQHPHAVEVKDVGTDDRGVPYFVLELLHGHTLEEELQQHGGRLTLKRTAQILHPMCAALDAAHREGILHRDIKPSNVFLHRDQGREVVKILDFGVARFVDGHVLERKLSNAGVPPGTPAYMAPERFHEGTYDGRVDVYSVGIMIYEMLTGRLPFTVDDGNILRLIRLHATRFPRPPRELRPELPVAIEAVVLSALSKDPQERPTAFELDRRFRSALSGDDNPTQSPRTG